MNRAYLASLLLLTACGQNSSFVAIPGPKGKDGQQGQSGTNGHNAIVTLAAASQSQCLAGGTIIVTATDMNDNGILDSADTNQQSATICNGQSPTQLTPVQAIKPCGANSSSYKEVLLLLSDGSILASFSETSSGKNTRLTLLPDGTYQNTDSSNCIFTVATSGNQRSISWSGGGMNWTIQ
jgi:hypothetical protein